ncbi:MAG: MBL fold metallo-hydrolase [Chitinispirillia bacterium]|nr:MBL fold metallo-hydrolase [Chitinispirillia bacterium]MCL2268190.1 MBL fold metallo-hydrolase [Chitinispirillia bacterium]
MEYKKIVTGRIETNTYVIPGGIGGCLVIDPADDCGEVIAYLRENRLNPLAILLTHGHFDHIMGVKEIVDAFGATGIEVYIHDGDKELLGNPARNGSAYFGESFSYSKDIKPLSDGPMKVGEFEFKVLHLPGHTQGGCAFLFEDVCFCGDTIFANSVGRTDLPGGDYRQLMHSINEKILTLPPETILCPGHGGRTTVEREMRSNPHL